MSALCSMPRRGMSLPHSADELTLNRSLGGSEGKDEDMAAAGAATVNVTGTARLALEALCEAITGCGEVEEKQVSH